MPDVARTLQQAIYDRLRGSSALALVLAPDEVEASPSGPAVYDHVPQAAESEDGAKFPYIVIGDDTAVNADTDDINGQETTITLHVWDRRRGKDRTKQVLGVVYDLLQNASLEVSGTHAVFCFWEFSESIPEPDVLVQHAVTRFRILTMEH